MIALDQLEAIEEIQFKAQQNALGQIELIAGVPYEKPLPKRLHVYLAMILEDLLRADLPPFTVLREILVLFGEDLRVPDLTVVPENARFEHDILVSTPLLCIEILSPKQTIASLFEKCEFYLQCGVPQCWVFWPEKRRAFQYDNEDGLASVSALNLNGRSYLVGDIFDRMPSAG